MESKRKFNLEKLKTWETVKEFAKELKYEIIINDDELVLRHQNGGFISDFNSVEELESFFDGYFYCRERYVKSVSSKRHNEQGEPEGF